MPISQVTAPEDAAKTAAAIQRVTEGGGAETLEKRYLRKDGSSFWAETTVSLQQDSHGRPLHLIVFIADITERKWAEKQLSESEDRYRAAFEQAAVGIVHSTLEGRILHCNQRFAEIVGYPLEVIRNLSFQQITAPEDLDSSLAANRQILSGAIESASIEKQCLRKDGSRVWARVTLSPQRNGAGRVIGLIAVVEEIQARKEAEERLAAADAAIRSCEERYRTVFETTPDAVTISRMSDGAILDCNQSFLGSAGFERDEVIGRTAQELGIWVNEADRLKFIEQMGHSAKVRDVEVLSRRKNGDIFWMRLSASLIEIGGEQCRLTFAKEITEVKAAEERTATTSEALRLSEQRYRAAFQTSLDAININRLEDGEYIDCNEAFLKMTGFTREEVIGKTSLELKIWTDGRDRQAMAEMVRLHGSFRGSEVQFRKKNGETLWGEMSASQIEIDGVSCILSVTRDISHAKVTENTIRTLAYYDPLTGLPNRRLLAERLHQTLAAGGRDGRSQALLFVELDHFKTLNETLGHQTGKMLLQEIALRVTACARETDTVGRVGGDEFALILEDLSEEGEEAAAQAKAVGEKIRAAIGLPVLLEGRECITTASIGITVFGAARESAEELMQEADIALYQAKSAGRNSVRFFSPPCRPR